MQPVICFDDRRPRAHLMLVQPRPTASLMRRKKQKQFQAKPATEADFRGNKKTKRNYRMLLAAHLRSHQSRSCMLNVLEFKIDHGSDTRSNIEYARRLSRSNRSQHEIRSLQAPLLKILSTPLTESAQVVGVGDLLRTSGICRNRSK